MAWIESHQEVGRHPKTKKLARLLGVSLPAAVGHLHYFWWWALDFAQDGTLEKYDGYDLADAMQWDGDPDQLVEALISAGYIDDTDDGLMIHDWGEYAGKLLERRAKDRARKRAAAEAAGVPQNFRRSSDGNDEESGETPSASFVTNQPTVPNQPNTTNSTEPTGQNHTNHAAERLRPLQRGASSPRRSDRRPRQQPSPRIRTSDPVSKLQLRRPRADADAALALQNEGRPSDRARRKT